MTAPEVTRADVGLRSERGPVLLAVMLTTGLVAIDATILATAVPAVVADLGGFAEFPWLFSVYLLAQAVSVPIYGKLADLVGRKPMMLLGIALFVVGSLLCGLAWSMTSLIVFRVVQGLGAGAVQPMGMTIIGDIYSVAERAKVQGYVASVWAMSALVGPSLGGVFADYLSWRWVFLVNLPLGAVAYWMIQRRFAEQVVRRRHQLDLLGAVLLTAGGVLLLLALLEGGVRWPWGSAAIITLLVTSAVLFAGFVLVERRAAEPVLPLWVFQRRTLVSSTTGGFVVGVVLMGLTGYVPLYAQGVLGTGAVVAGLALAGMMLGWPLAAANAGRLYLGVGFRATMLLGAAAAAAGGALLTTTVGSDSPVWWLAAPCFLIGIGFGLVVSPSVVAAQASVAWQHRGMATGATVFARSLGSAVGVAAFGAIANGIVADRLGAVPHDLEGLPADVLDPAIQAVFLAAALVTALLAAAALVMPKRVEETDDADVVTEA